MIQISNTTPEHLAHDFSIALSDHQNALFHTGDAEDLTEDFAGAVVKGLSASPRWLDCRFLYDARGSDLYEQITAQPEYYQTRTEAQILHHHAGAIADITGPVVLLELGSGSSVKTNHLLHAYLRHQARVCYVPVDVSETALLDAAYAIRRHHPDAQVIGVHGTYERAFALMDADPKTMVVFLGSTIGNLNEQESDDFWRGIQEHLPAGNYFLLGVDLIKDPAIIEAAYNDRAGVTAAFTRNLFTRMNTELGASLDIDAIEHVATYNEQRERVEIEAVFTRTQTVQVAPAGQSFEIATGERILTEISRKFSLDALIPYLETYGLRARKVMTDPNDLFGLLLLERVDT